MGNVIDMRLESTTIRTSESEAPCAGGGDGAVGGESAVAAGAVVRAVGDAVGGVAAVCAAGAGTT